MNYILKQLYVVTAITVTLCQIQTIQASWEDILIKSNEQFTVQMFNEILKEETHKNFIMSGLSVLPPLALLETGATGQTLSELLKILNMADSDIFDVFRYLNQRIMSVKGVVFKSACKMYFRENCRINSTFACMSRDAFRCENESINFLDPNRVAVDINGWVEKITDKHITNIVDVSNFDKKTKIVLINAIYFKGKWEIPFACQFTKLRDFYITEKETVQKDFMTHQYTYSYTESSDLKARLIELFYIERQVSMLIILPDKIEGIDEVLGIIQKDRSLLTKAISQMSTTYQVIIRLPKFIFKSEIDLKDILTSMNVKGIFNKNSELINVIEETCKTCKKDLYVNLAKQKVFIEIDEAEETATGGSAFKGKGLASHHHRGDQYKKFYADHPFLFIIRNKALTLFTGVFRK